MDIIERAKILRKNIIISSSSLDDKMASQTPELFDRLKQNGELIKVGTKISWNEQA